MGVPLILIIIVSNFQLDHSFRLESFLIIRVGDSFDGLVCYMPLYVSTFLHGISVSLKIIKNPSLILEGVDIVTLAFLTAK